MSKNKYPNRCEKLVLAVMLKNEQRIKITFDSVKDYIGEFVIFDTGSTDDTVERVTKYCSEHDIKLHLKQGTFVDFSVSRNEMLEYADEIYKENERYLLLLDANDEMKDMPALVKFVQSHTGPQSGFHLTQRWWCGNSMDSYCNIRMIRTGHTWRYKCRVHEYIRPTATDGKADADRILRVNEGYIYQDRTLDDDTSYKRFKRDKQLLYEAYKEDPHEPRTLFYLAQTCSCLGLQDEAYRYYVLRLKEVGFFEEIYSSYHRLGDLAQTLGHDWDESMGWYLKAYQHSQRAEPLVKIAEHYIDYNLQGEKQPEWHTCYMFANMACQLIFPINQILFVDRRVYTYKRHHLLGRSAYYVGRYKEGKEACLRAIDAENQDIDKHNLKFYLEKEIEIIQGGGLNPLSLVAISFGDKEVRSKDEFEIKHDRVKSILDVIDKIVEERRKDSKALPAHVVELLKRGNNVLGVTSSIPQSLQAGTAPTVVTNSTGGPLIGDSQQLASLPRKDRRAKLREMLKAKKKEKKSS